MRPPVLGPKNGYGLGSAGGGLPSIKSHPSRYTSKHSFQALGGASRVHIDLKGRCRHNPAKQGSVFRGLGKLLVRHGRARACFRKGFFGSVYLLGCFIRIPLACRAVLKGSLLSCWLGWVMSIAKHTHRHTEECKHAHTHTHIYI